LCFYSGYVLDKQLESVASSYFILDYDFQYRKMMPVWSVKTWLTELKNTFNLSITFNSFTRTFNLNRNDVLITKPATKDYSHLVSEKMIVRDSKDAVNNFLLKWVLDSSDPLAPPVLQSDNLDAAKTSLPYPLVADTNGYTVLESNLQPCYEEIRIEYPNFTIDLNPFAIFPPNNDPFRAVTYQSLICGKPLYNDPSKIEDTPPRIFFYNEGFDGSLKRGAYNLVWDDLLFETDIRFASGIYESFWKNTLNKLDGLKEVETDIALTAVDIAGLDNTEKIFVSGNHYLVKQLKVDFPLLKASRIIFWRC